MAAAIATRSFLRSATISARPSAARIATGAKHARSPFRLPTQKPLSHRIFRSPVEMSSVVVGSLCPLHSATASALLTSMLSTAPYSCGWTIDDS
ncbi:protein NUCLEAR FUSION DEFECTIVE 6, mitochondrial-like [Rutidosis leptorrhynchoides]|uniref:protein NUCLEAR FUSION DEFECTIVE 6, mitochondrial-like n=1 Tax=Rutidosis leptorrhynchoides TaxID=125765 RepID=UPI003A99AC0E